MYQKFVFNMYFHWDSVVLYGKEAYDYVDEFEELLWQLRFIQSIACPSSVMGKHRK